MKKKIFLLSILAIIGIFLILTIISMSIYISSFEYWYSFMTLETAIIILVSSCFVLIAVIGGIIIIVFKPKGHKTKRENT